MDRCSTRTVAWLKASPRLPLIVLQLVLSLYLTGIATAMETIVHGADNAPVVLSLTPEEKSFVKNHPVIRVSNEMDWAPFDFSVSNRAFGFSIDLMNLLAQRLGIKIVYTNGYSWTELMHLFREGRIDVLQSVFHSKAREAMGLFTQPYFKDKTVFIIPRHAAPISDITQLHGKTVAIPRGFSYETFLAHHHPGIKILHVPNMETAFRAITEGRADASIELSAVARFMFEKHYFDTLKISGWFKSYDQGQKRALHLLVQKSMPLLHGMLEKALATLAPGELIELEKKWLGYRNIYPRQRMILTEKEQAFLQKNPLIRVANEMDWPPFDYVDNGKPAGFVIDYFSLIGEIIGVKFKFINGFPWSELLEMGKQKKIDVFPGIWKTPEREPFFLFSPPYMKPVKVLVSKDKTIDHVTSLSEIKGKKIALPRGYGTTELIINAYPGPEYVIVDNTADGLKKLAMGVVDGFVGTLGVINHITRQQFIQDVKVIMEVSASQDLPLQMAVRNDWPVMLDMINRAMGYVTPDQFDKLSSKWMGSMDGVKKIESLSMQEKLYLEKKDSLRICVPNGVNPPYETITPEGDYQGIVARYYQQIAAKIGLQLSWKSAETLLDARHIIATGQADVISLVPSGVPLPEDIQTTPPFTAYPLVIATDNRALFINRIQTVADKKIGIDRTRPFYAQIRQAYPAVNIIPVDSLEKGLEMVQAGDLFGCIDTAPAIGHQIQKNRMVSLKISGEIPMEMQFRSGVKHSNHLLANILEKAAGSLSQEENAKLFQSWMQLNYQKEMDYDFLVRLGVGVLFIGIFFLYRHTSITRYNKKLATLNADLVAANQQLETISYVDGLTGVFNRRRFDIILKEEWSRCERNQKPLSLMMIDIDHFKRYNDRYGHLSGDECLKLVARTLNCPPCRAADSTARYGGEEFVIVLPETDGKGGENVARKILKKIKNLKIPHEDSPTAPCITVSIGVTTALPAPGLAPRQLVDFADQLLYQAKNEGRNRHVFAPLQSNLS